MFTAKQHKGPNKTSSALFASAGNSFIQHKLNIGKPNDKYEVEADRVADQVVNKTSVTSDSSFFSPATTIQKREIQKQEETEDIQEKPIAQSITPLVQLETAEEDTVQEKCATCESEDSLQRKEDEEERSIQAKAETQPKPLADLGNRIQHSRGNGKPLDQPTLNTMEQGFGTDFSNVRIHTDSKSVSMNSDLGARAFTNKNDIFFNKGEFNPQSKDGQTLLAHELTHTIQQGKSTTRSQVFRKEASLSINSDASICEKYPPLIVPKKEENNTNTADIPDNKPKQKVTDVSAKGKTVKSQSQKEKNPVSEIDQLSKKEGTTKEFPKTPKEDAQFHKISGDIQNVKNSQDRTIDIIKTAEEAELSAEKPNSEDISTGKANKVRTVNEKTKNFSFDKNEFKINVLKLVEQELPNDKDKNKKYKKKSLENITRGPFNHIENSQKQQREALNIPRTEPDTKFLEPLYDKKVEASTQENPGKKPSIHKAERAIPKAVSSKEVALDKTHDADSLERAMEDEKLQEFDTKLTENQLTESNEPDFIETLGVKKEGQKVLCKISDQLRNEEVIIQKKATQDAQRNLDVALKSKHIKRKQVFEEVDKGKGKTKDTDELLLHKYYAKLACIFKSTSDCVKQSLEVMDTSVMKSFNNAMKLANDIFKQNVKNRLDDYYGVGILNLSDEGDDFKERMRNKLRKKQIGHLISKLSETTDKNQIKLLKAQIKALEGQHEATIVERIFEGEKTKFLSTLNIALDGIAETVEQGLKTAIGIVVKGEKDINTASKFLPDHLKEEAKERTEDFKSRFKDLKKTIYEKEKVLTQTLAKDYAKNVKQLKETFEKIREESAMPWWEKAWLAIKRIVTIIYDLGKLLVNVLIKAASVIGDIVAHPIKFVGNLISAVGAGLNNFVENVGTHLENIVFKLIMGTVPAHIKMPASLDPKNLFSFALDVLGLTKENIRSQIVGRLGEPIVSKLESTFDLLILFKKEGFAGLWEHIKEKIGDLKKQVIEEVKDYFKKSIIKAAVKFLLSALTPASGFIKACETIINVAKFFIQNLKNLIQLLDSILDSFIDIAKGKLGNAAKRVENALADILLIGIKFLASLIGVNLNMISTKVMTLFNAIRNPVNRAIKWLIDKAVAFADRTGLIKFAQKGREKFEQGKEWVKEKGKGAVAGLVKWFGFRRKFKTKDNKDHELLVQDKGNVELWVKSTPKKVSDMLKNHPDKGSETWKEAKKHYNDFYKSAPKLAALDEKYETATGNDVDSLKGKIKIHIKSITSVVTKLADALKILGLDGQIDETILTNITPNSGSLLTTKNAKPLTALPGNTKGNSRAATAGDIPGWLHLKSVKNSGTDADIFDKYVRFHIIHDQMHGPANSSNLVAATKDANNAYYRGMEVNVLRKLYSPGTIMFLEVSLKYHSSPHTEFLQQATAKWGYMKLDGVNKTPIVDKTKVGDTISVRSDAPPNVSGVVTVKLHGKGEPQLLSTPISLPPGVARRLAAALKEYPGLPVFDVIDSYYTLDRIFKGRKPFSEYKKTDKSAVKAAVANNPNIDLKPI